MKTTSPYHPQQQYLRLSLTTIIIISYFAGHHVVPLTEASFVKSGGGGWDNTRSSRRTNTPVGRQNSAIAEQRQPWDAIRFIKQSSKFVNLPQVFPSRRGDKKNIQPGDIIWEPGTPYPWQWSPLDDVVMGGASSSTFSSQTGIWSGTVTSANNGGFVGIRSTSFSSALDLTSCQGLEFKFRGGDGKRFKAIVRDSTSFNGVCWTTSFDVKRGGGVVKVPFEGMVPTIFAKIVPGEEFKVDNVVGLQLTYSKFEYDGDLNPNFSLGDFSLQVLKIVAY